MVARGTTVVDISTLPEVARLVEEVERSNAPVQLTPGADIVAVITPVPK